MGRTSEILVATTRGEPEIKRNRGTGQDGRDNPHDGGVDPTAGTDYMTARGCMGPSRLDEREKLQGRRERPDGNWLHDGDGHMTGIGSMTGLNNMPEIGNMVKTIKRDRPPRFLMSSYALVPPPAPPSPP